MQGVDCAALPRGRDPGLLGDVRVVGGRVEIYGKRLRVVAGGASLDGSADPDPFLDVVAEYRVRDVLILVRLVGPVSSLKVEPDSEPPTEGESGLYLFWRHDY